MKRSGVGLLGATLLCAYACAKATDSDLGGGAYDPRAGRGGSGAKPGTAGFGGTGGSSTGGTAGRGGSSSGRAGTGTGGSSTGGTGTGGTGTGGSSGSGNATATGGTGNSTGGTLNQGGEAGDVGIPPDVLANANVVLHYAAHNHDATSQAVEAYLYFENKSADPLDLTHTLVRYWTTPEGSYGNLKCYYAMSIGTANVLLAFVPAGDESHIDITFAAGSIPAHNTSIRDTVFQMKLDAQNGDTFDQTNDWSFDGTLTSETSPAPNPKIAVYLADKLVWGCEPGGKCAGEDGAGGAGGQGGESGVGGTAGSGATSGSGGTAGSGATGGIDQGGAGQGGEPSVGQGGA